jgi:ribosomal-protein-alanine N-acetyltransferase
MAVERPLSTIETARLRGERIGPQHHDELSALLGDPRVGATLGGALTPERVAGTIVAKEAHWNLHGFGYWVWREKATGEPVARGGLQRTHVGGRDEVEVGWAVTSRRWGEGFATELGAASVRFGFERLQLREIVSYTLPDNVASRRVMEKLGFAFEREIEHAGLPHVLYRLVADAAP